MIEIIGKVYLKNTKNQKETVYFGFYWSPTQQSFGLSRSAPLFLGVRHLRDNPKDCCEAFSVFIDAKVFFLSHHIPIELEVVFLMYINIHLYL